MFPPENTCMDPGLLPRGLAWGRAYRRAKEKRGELMTFRLWLDNLRGVVVRFDYFCFPFIQFSTNRLVNP